MATLSAYATTATQTAGTWTNPTNGTGADNAAFASWVSTTRSATATLTLGGFGAWSAIPAGATINSITVRVKGYSSTTAAPISSVTSQLFDGTTGIGTATTHTLSTTTTNVYSTFVVTGVTLAQLQADTLAVRHTATRTNSTTSATVFVDSVQITVDYTEAGSGGPTTSRINATNISGGSTNATAYSVAVGTALLAGDVIVAVANSNGTHVTNGMSVVAGNGNGAMTTVNEMQNGGSSSRWGQVFIIKLTAPMAATDTLTFTPYAGATSTSIDADVFRGFDATVSRGPSVTATTVNTSSPTAALSPAPPAGDLVLSLLSVGSGAATPPAGYTLGSSSSVSSANAIGYALADGTATYGGNWTIVNNTSATTTLALAALAGGTPAQGYWGIPL